jgi:hypothetical protein
MRPFVVFMSGAAEAKHARLLFPEMHNDVTLQKLDEPRKQFNVPLARTAVFRHFFEPVDVGNQHPMLGINQRMSGLKLLVPVQHKPIFQNLWSKSKLWAEARSSVEMGIVIFFPILALAEPAKQPVRLFT